jgi:CheY-like chemotaxis protein
MVFGIVSQAGGAIDVASELGQGTTFQILLPRAKEVVHVKEEPEKILDLDGRARGQVLLVEDDAGVRELCRSVLRREGYEVLEAADPTEALLIHEEHCTSIDLLISDIVMPKMSGLVLAEKLRKRVPDLPVLFMSGYAPDHVAGQPVEMRHVLQKPFRPSELLRRVSTALYGLDSQAPPPPNGSPSPEAENMPPAAKVPFADPALSGIHLTSSEGKKSELSSESSALRETGKTFGTDELEGRPDDAEGRETLSK